MKLTGAVTLVSLTALPLVAMAQDSAWEGEAELGVLVTTGNTEETNLKGRLAFLQEEKGLYAEARGGAVGREDQFYSAELSWLGRARLRGSRPRRRAPASARRSPPR